MIYASQIRAARALVDISQTELSKRAGLSLATIKRVEASSGNMRMTVETLLCIQAALEKAGVVFIEGDKQHGPGVRLRKPRA
jgi:transcriptional regulator with XRE-family HTH domain